MVRPSISRHASAEQEARAERQTRTVRPSRRLEVPASPSPPRVQTTHLKTLQGVISFDANGDLVNKVITVFQVVHNAKYPDDDSLHQFKYIGVAPEN